MLCTLRSVAAVEPVCTLGGYDLPAGAEAAAAAAAEGEEGGGGGTDKKKKKKKKKVSVCARKNGTGLAQIVCNTHAAGLGAHTEACMSLPFRLLPAPAAAHSLSRRPSCRR